MKAERRHELKHNVLDAELGKIALFFRERGAQIAWGALIAVLALAVTWYFLRARTRSLADKLSRYDRLVQMEQVPGAEEEVLAGFKELVAQGKPAWLAADSAVRVGNLSLRQGLATNDPEERNSLRDDARRSYEKVLAGFSDQSVSAAQAHLGLAALGEDLGDWEAARKEYETVKSMQGPDVQSAVKLAQKGLGRLERLQEPVELATTRPETQPAPTTGKASGPVERKK